MIKILCVSDTVDPIVYSQNIKERYKDVAFVIGAGDLRMKYYGFIVSSLNKTLYFVFGNHHLEDFGLFRKTGERNSASLQDGSMLTQNFYGSTYLGNGKIIRDKKTKLLIGGVGGCLRYNNGKNQYSELEMTMLLIKMIPGLLLNKLLHKKYLDILVTHAPPFGIHDREDRCHTGFKCYLWFMRTFKPRYLLHGHVHLIDLNENSITRYHDTDIINVYSRYLLTIEDV